MKNNVCICIPTLNEYSSIGSVIYSFKCQGYDNILVIDGGSTDNTKYVAERAGAKVIEQTWEGGKGAAMREAIELIDESIIVFIDGDLTYEPKDIDKLVEPIQQNEADHVLACRFDNMHFNAMSGLHKFGNKIINIIFKILYKKDVRDLLTGYRAIRKDSISNLNLESDGFCIETELTAKSILNDCTIKIIPSSYFKRKGSESKLNSFKDGPRIMYSIFKYRFILYFNT